MERVRPYTYYDRPSQGARLCPLCCVPKTHPPSRGHNNRSHMCRPDSQHGVLQCPRLAELDFTKGWNTLCDLISTNGPHKHDRQSVHAEVMQLINAHVEETQRAQKLRHIQASAQLQATFTRAANNGPRGVSDPEVFGNAMREARVLFPDRHDLPRGPTSQGVCLPKDSRGFRDAVDNPLQMPRFDSSNNFNGARVVESHRAPRHPETCTTFWRNVDRTTTAAPHRNAPTVSYVRRLAQDGNLFVTPPAQSVHDEEPRASLHHSGRSTQSKFARTRWEQIVQDFKEEVAQSDIQNDARSSNPNCVT